MPTKEIAHHPSLLKYPLRKVREVTNFLLEEKGYSFKIFVSNPDVFEFYVDSQIQPALMVIERKYSRRDLTNTPGLLSSKIREYLVKGGISVRKGTSAVNKY